MTTPVFTALANYSKIGRLPEKTLFAGDGHAPRVARRISDAAVRPGQNLTAACLRNQLTAVRAENARLEREIATAKAETAYYSGLCGAPTANSMAPGLRSSRSGEPVFRPNGLGSSSPRIIVRHKERGAG